MWPLRACCEASCSLDERTRKTIEHGRRIRAVLEQRQFAPLSLGEEVALLSALSDGVLDTVPLDQILEAELLVREAAARLPREVHQRLLTDGQLTGEDRKSILTLARQALERLDGKR